MTGRIFAAAAALLILLLAAPALAEENVDIVGVVDAIDLSKLEEAAEGTDVDVREMVLSIASGEDIWDIDQLLEKAKDTLLSELANAAGMVMGLLAPALLSALARQLAGDGRGTAVVSQIAYLVCAAKLTTWFVRLIADAQALTQRIASLSDAVFPVMATLLSLSGATASAALVTPLSALAGNAFSALLAGVGLKLCAIASALAVAGNLSPKLKLDRLFELVKAVVNWTTGVLMTGFLGLSAVKALLGSGYDSAAVRTARYAVDNLLPIIGGVVISAVAAFLGVGGGFLLVPFLTAISQLPMYLAAGTSALAVLISMITSILTLMTKGTTIDWALIGTEMVGVAIGSIVGPYTSKYFSDTWLKRLFIVLAFYVGIDYVLRGFFDIRMFG